MYSILPELRAMGQGLQEASSAGLLSLLCIAIGIACAFEFVNGFHDTANAVATVIYTRSLRPWKAVILSGTCNFLGVFLGGISVAMAIVHLLPQDLVAGDQLSFVKMAMIFAMLVSALIWNLGTWYFGIPASSSHSMLGAILGIGVGYAFLNHLPLETSVNWSKAGDVGLALLISPLFGFVTSAAAIYTLRKFRPNSRLQQAPKGDDKPPLGIRLVLIGTSSGVSFAHGSNDGQKGVGLVMLILITLLPMHFAINPSALTSKNELAEVRQAALHLRKTLSGLVVTSEEASSLQREANSFSQKLENRAYGADTKSVPANSATNAVAILVPKAVDNIDRIASTLAMVDQGTDLSVGEKSALRTQILNLDKDLKAIERTIPNLTPGLKSTHAKLMVVTEYAPLWVIIMIALSLGIGTTVGWKRIVVTIGEKIGKSHLTYGQGAVSELVAMSTIGLSALAGLPVSTTHCLSSGVAGSMFASRAGVQSRTVKNIALAWLLTLPVTMILSSLFFVAAVNFMPHL